MGHVLSHSHGHEEHSSNPHGNNDGAVCISDSNHSSQNGKSNTMSREAKVVLMRLYIATALCGTFLIVEVIGGLWSSSLAILSDAAHLLADLASFAVAIGAAHLAIMPSSEVHTYGLKRAESLAALLSMVSLALVSLFLAYEAIRRLFFIQQQQVDGTIMSGVAMIGVLVNIVLALILGEHHTHMPGADHGHDHSHDNGGHGSSCHDTSPDNHENGENTPLVVAPIQSDEAVIQEKEKKQQQRNVNLHAAYLHVMGDLAQSAAVLVAGVVIWWQPTWHVVDPMATLFFCTLVFCSTIPVIKSSVAVLVEEVPPNVDWKSVHNALEKVQNVSNVHDLHIWSISHGIPGLTVHCLIHATPTSTISSSADAVVAIHRQALKDLQAVCVSFGITHVTIQAQLTTNAAASLTYTKNSGCNVDEEAAATATDCIL